MTEPGTVLVMGPAGCGKTTVGRALADRLGAVFLDADDYHPPANIAVMRRGEALTDADRCPWLRRVAAVVADHEAAGHRVILACSALKHRYRRALGFPAARRDVVELRVERNALAARLAARGAHFFDPALLDSQLAILEAPGDELAVNAEAPVGTVVDRILFRLGVSDCRPD